MEAERVIVSQGKPPREVVEALEMGVVHMTRRVEVYESDGKTLWNPDEENDPRFSRLSDGNVNVDYNSPERRKLDITLNNEDKLLRPDPNGGFWYDKIIKVFRGVEYQGKSVAPYAAIIEAPTDVDGRKFLTTVSAMGFTNTAFIPEVTEPGDLADYSFVMAFSGTAITQRAELLEELWNSGKHIVTLGVMNGVNEIPFISSTVLSGSLWGVSPAPGDHPGKGAFTLQQEGVSVTGHRPLGLVAGAQRISLWTPITGLQFITASIAMSANGSYWLDLHLPDVNAVQTKAMFRAVLNYMRGFNSKVQWETQLGEFMIDNISADHFPYQVKVTGRDYTKKLMNSKVERTVVFGTEYTVKEVVRNVAINAGIDPARMRIGMGTEKLESEMSYERGTARWDIVKAACEAYDYEVFFDASGFFVVRKFIDPTTDAVSWTFKTGYEPNAKGANLVNYSRSMNDSRIYNHIVVQGDPADGENRLPYFGEAKNEDSNSTTRIERLGDRMLQIITNWLKSDKECINLAKARLKISALESYELSFSSIYYPWMEVGEVSDILDPDRLDFEPEKFLIDGLGYPLGLGPMTGTGKRVTYVGKAGTPEDIIEGE